MRLLTSSAAILQYYGKALKNTYLERQADFASRLRGGGKRGIAKRMRVNP